jgi:DNA-binding YbaB/EbfC family protein
LNADEGEQFDLGSLISQLGQVQQNLQQAQAEAAAQVVEGTAGGGAVKVRINGGLEFLSVTIDSSVVDPSEIDLLQDLVLAAVRDGIEKASTLATSALGGAGLGIPGAGSDLGGLLGGLVGPGHDESGEQQSDEHGSVEPGE